LLALIIEIRLGGDMRLICLLTFLSISSFANADWELQTSLADIDTADRFEIARSFFWAPSAMQNLLADELASTSKIIVTKAQVKVGLYNWKNDEFCTIKDPSSYNNTRLLDYAYEFHYKDDTNDKVRLEGAARPVLKCDDGRSLAAGKAKFTRI
jgi:hypothetical protein